jgi:hypothetical protein
MPDFYLNSYVPLVASPYGRDACERLKLPPFIDGSVRREPDIKHATPTISCLCRGTLFAPRLKPGDFVAYMTRLDRYGSPRKQRRLTAVLRVSRVFQSHDDAALWFYGTGQQLPSNCMVPQNPCEPVERSHRIHVRRDLDDRTLRGVWDAGYLERSKACGRFVVCDRLWHDVSWDAPEVHESDLRAAFNGKVPGTRNPGKQTVASLKALLKRLRLDVRLSAP